MPYTDSHGRPEILVHPNIVGGPATWRTEPADVDKDAGPAAPGRPRTAVRRPRSAANNGDQTE